MFINESSWDRGIRMILGVAIMSLAYWGPQSPWAFLGLIPLITGFVGFCPIYVLFGYETCSNPTSKN